MSAVSGINCPKVATSCHHQVSHNKNMSNRSFRANTQNPGEPHYSLVLLSDSWSFVLWAGELFLEKRDVQGRERERLKCSDRKRESSHPEIG